jgi:hypothetical protein
MAAIHCPALLAVSAFSILAACGVKEEAGSTLFALDNCKRVNLVDAENGRAITGAEDLDLDRLGGRLFVSAYDRIAVESAVRRGADSIPEGGLYTVPLSGFESDEILLKAQPFAAEALAAGGLRPHGVAYDEASGEFHAINRRYVREKGRWRLRAQLLTFSPDGKLSASRDIACSANDLTVFEGRLLATLDHTRCGIAASLEDVFGLKQARLVDGAGATIVKGIGFANGAAALADGRVVIAATRERVLYPVALKEGGADKQEAIPLGAGPDNLSLSDGGRIVAALHPSLPAVGLQRRLGVGRSPSRIVEVDPATGERRILFDDPRASMVSSATVAIHTNQLLIIGSVIDPGLVVCRSES